MPILKDFLYFLTNEQGQSGTDRTGSVEFVSEQLPLPETPDGYNEKSIGFTRNSLWGGVFRSFTTPLKFIGTAAHIVRNRLIKFGTETKLFLIILWLDKSFNGGWVHRSLYKGEIDMSTVESEETHVTANIMEGGLIKFLNANKDVTYEIPLNVPEAIYVESDGIPIDYSNKWGTITEELERRSLGSLDRYFYSCTLFTVDSETNPALVGLSTNQGIVTDYANSLDYFAESTKEITATFKLKFAFDISQSNQSRDGYVRMQIRDDSGTVLNEFYTEDLPDDFFVASRTVDTTVTLTIPANKRLFIGWDLQVRRQTIGSGEAVLKVQVKETEFSAAYTYTAETTYVRHLRPAYVAQQLLNKITGSTDYTFESNYLSTVWRDLVITSGNGVRGIDAAVIKTSFSDFFTSYNVPCSLYLTIVDKKMIIEKYEEQFNGTVIAQLGDGTNFIYKVATDLLFSSIKIGYPNFTYENVNGKAEFNTTQTYTSPIKRVNKTLELVSKYRADSYGYEFIRVKGVGKDTTDLTTDNDVFFTHIDSTAIAGAGNATQPAEYFRFLRRPYSSISGLIKPLKVWNVEISPKRCLLRHGSRLHSFLYWENTKSLLFSSSEKDTAMVTTDSSGAVISERADQVIGNFDAPVFLPIELKIETPINRDTLTAVQTNLLGTVSFSDGTNTFYGFINDLKIQPSTLPSQETTMYCSPLTDLNKLIF
ncbi:MULTISPECIES: hypothetical protein [unclassified Paraflavitalea]|uniref:hypothetical protein n=1 Tax=unclassified Paraflavitalea TaxID=2798305 RepID=UPI003D3403E7